MNISVGLTQCGLIRGSCRDGFIMKLINLLIGELDSCSLGGDFPVSRHAEFVNLIAFPQKLISKEHVIVIMELPDWVQVKMKIL